MTTKLYTPLIIASLLPQGLQSLPIRQPSSREKQADSRNKRLLANHKPTYRPIQTKPKKNYGPSPLQPPHRLNSQPSKQPHNPALATSTSTSSAPKPPQKSKRLHSLKLLLFHPLLILLILFQQQHQEFNRKLHLLLHAHFNTDFRQHFSARVCSRSSPA